MKAETGGDTGRTVIHTSKLGKTQNSRETAVVIVSSGTVLCFYEKKPLKPHFHSLSETGFQWLTSPKQAPLQSQNPRVTWAGKQRSSHSTPTPIMLCRREVVAGTFLVSTALGVMKIQNVRVLNRGDSGPQK